MIGIAITSIVTPVATIISCGDNGSGGKTPNPPTPPTPSSLVLNLSNYKQYTTYDINTGTLTIKEGINEISNIFRNGYIPDPSKPNDTVPINSLTLPSTLEKIDNNAFLTSELTSLTILDSVTTIGNSAFYEVINNSNTHVTMPSKFNNDSDKDSIKDSIFGVGHWDQITFNWI